MIRRQGGQIRHISEIHPAYDPLQYPLLFPRGEDGWNLSLHDRSKITLNDWATFYLQIRANNRESSLIHLSGRLFHQYLVDMFAKVEGNR